MLHKNVTFTRQPSDRKALATFLRLSLPKKAIEEQKTKKPLRRGAFYVLFIYLFLTISDNDSTVIGGHSLSGEIIDDRRRC